MNIVGYGGITYLYINGLRIHTGIQIDSRITLLPANLPSDPGTYYRAAKSEVDMGMIMLYRHTIHSQLKIVESDPKDLAFYAASSLWDLLIISALFDCEAECMFQCNKPAEDLDEGSDLLVTNYNMYGLRAPVYEMTKADVIYLQQNIETIRTLLDNDGFRNAVHCLVSYKWHIVTNVQLAIVWSGIESLFRVEAEITFRISLYIARYLEADNNEAAKELFDDVKKLYKARSSAVHGNKGIRSSNKDDLKKSTEILRRLIKKCIDEKQIPNTKCLLF